MVHVIVCGGSVGGLAAATALLKAGCTVEVLERASSIMPAGAGLGLDPNTFEIMDSFGLGKKLDEYSIPRPYEYVQLIDDDKNPRELLLNRRHDYNSLNIDAGNQDSNRGCSDHWVRDEDCRYSLWSDLHKVLFDNLPPDTVLWGHQTTTFQRLPDTKRVRLTVQVGRVNPIEKEMECDLLVACDGNQSTIRQALVPHDRKRYSGFIAWRGVISKREQPEAYAAMHEAYKYIKEAIHYDLTRNKDTGYYSHTAVYEIPKERINWMIYEDCPEPVHRMKGTSLTIQTGKEEIEQMQARAEQMWLPAFAQMVKATPDPFINVIYDRNPLDQWVFGRVVLLGEAAHPTTPHCGRSTNMSIADASTLGRCVETCQGDIDGALQQYQTTRIPMTTREVLFSRYMGQLRQGHLHPKGAYRWHEADAEMCNELCSENMHSFDPKAYLHNCVVTTENNGVCHPEA